MCREKWGFFLFDENAPGRALRGAHASKKPGIQRRWRCCRWRWGLEPIPSIFSTVDTCCCVSLPYPHSDRLFAVWSRSALKGAAPIAGVGCRFSNDWRAQSHAFESLTAYASWPMNLTNIDEPRRLETELVTASFFSTLGVPAQLRRTFALDEDREQSSS